jgi:hypothetical protein
MGEETSKPLTPMPTGGFVAQTLRRTRGGEVSKLKKGDIVKLTQQAKEQGIHRKSDWKLGIVTRVNSPYICVKREGGRQGNRYHEDFWKRIPK